MKIHSLLVAVGIGLGGFAIAQPGDLLVVPVPNKVGAAVDKVKGLVKSRLADSRVLLVRKPVGVSAGAFANQLRGSGLYSAVSIDRELSPCAGANDPLFSQQWHLTQISAPRAWDFAVGSSAPIVAIIDAGCDITHPDLAASMVPGYNTISGLPQSGGGDVSDVGTTGHGTRCMSIAVARGNNGVGISGVGWNLRGMPVRATNNANGNALLSELLEGVTWAVSNGARVVSVSYAGVSDPTIEATGAWVRTQNALLVWAAGNDNADLASFDHKNVTIVGGTDQNDQKISNSNYGRAVDCYAPATQVYTARKGGLYGNMPQGTSAAAPQVAATLALMMERQPTWAPSLVERRMLLYCRDLGAPGPDTTWGYGRLNTGTAVALPARTYDWSMLPLPNGLTWTIPVAINNLGQVLGVGWSEHESPQVTYNSRTAVIWRDGVVETTRRFDMVRPHTYALGDINDSGKVVLTMALTPTDFDINWSLTLQSGWGSSIALGGDAFAWDVINNTVYRPDPGFGFYFYLVSVNEFGMSPMTAAHMGAALNAQVRYANFQAPWSSIPPPAGTTTAGFYSGNDAGQVVGFARYTPFSGVDWVNSVSGFVFVAPNTYQPLSEALGGVSRPHVITNRGAIYGEAGTSPLPTNMQPVIWDAANPNVVEPLKDSNGLPVGMGKVVLAANEQGEVLGADQAANPAVPLMLDGASSGPITSLLSSPLPPGFGDFRVARSINELGQFVGSAVLAGNGLERTFIFTPNDGRYAAVNFGADGLNPVYVGSIPPSLSVTFTTPEGQAIPGTTSQVTFNSATGRMPLVVPEAVGPTFRMYLRANRDDVPGYNGTRFLNRLYPPIGQPAVPRDVAYLPLSGPPDLNGQPSIEMFAGDVDGSQEIDASDIDLVIAAFGSVDGDPGWNPDPDCDGSGEVDAADIDRVIANFGLVGDVEP